MKRQSSDRMTMSSSASHRLPGRSERLDQHHASSTIRLCVCFIRHLRQHFIQAALSIESVVS